MHTAFFAAASEPSGLGTLGINGQAFLIQLVTFLLFFVVLEKLAMKPLLKRLNARRRVVDDGVTLGLELQEQKAHLDEEIAKALQAARSEADQILEEGRKSASMAIKEAETNARIKVEAILADGAERVKEDISRARSELEDDIASLVGDVSEAVIGEELTSSHDTSFIKKTIREQLSA
jgi:F-type H+-transporting ATPase subunit b